MKKQILFITFICWAITVHPEASFWQSMKSKISSWWQSKKTKSASPLKPLAPHEEKYQQEQKILKLQTDKINLEKQQSKLLRELQAIKEKIATIKEKIATIDNEIHDKHPSAPARLISHPKINPHKKTVAKNLHKKPIKYIHA